MHIHVYINTFMQQKITGKKRCGDLFIGCTFLFIAVIGFIRRSSNSEELELPGLVVNFGTFLQKQQVWGSEGTAVGWYHWLWCKCHVGVGGKWAKRFEGCFNGVCGGVWWWVFCGEILRIRLSINCGCMYQGSAHQKYLSTLYNNHVNIWAFLTLKLVWAY